MTVPRLVSAMFCMPRKRLVGMQNLRKIRAWRRGLDLVVEIYRLTGQFPRSELFSLTFQLRKAALRVPSVIAEGNERDTAKDRRHFLTLARGSLAEIETELTAAYLLRFVTRGDLLSALEITDHLSRMITNMRRNVRDREERS